VSELKQKAIQGVRWTTLSAAFSAGGGVLQTLILTRLLDRADFGLMAIVSVVVGLALQMVDLGFSYAIVRERDPSPGLLHSLYWLNVLMSLLMALLVWFIAPHMAWFFEMPALENLLYWACPAFLVSGLTIQYQALLQKSLAFKQLALVEILSFAAGFLTTVALAWTGYGALSLVLGVLAKTGTAAMLTLLVSIGRAALPRLYFSWAEVKPIWQFGAFQVVERIVNYVNTSADTLLIGKLLGQEVLGVYEVVKQFLIKPMFIINPVVNKVTYPVMAQVHHDQARLRNIAWRAIQLVAAITAPLYMAAAVGASLIVPVLFTAKWAAGIEAFRWLSLFFLIRCLMNPLGFVLLAKGKAHYALFFQIGVFFGLLTALLIGLQFGLNGMVLAMVAFNLALLLPFHLFVSKPLLRGPFTEFLSQFLPEAGLALAAFGLAYLAVLWLPAGWFSLIAYALTGGALYLWGLLRRRPLLRADLLQMIRQ
jgi:O-antigen/teichoic acid export membrane protein